MNYSDQQYRELILWLKSGIGTNISGIPFRPLTIGMPLTEYINQKTRVCYVKSISRKTFTLWYVIGNKAYRVKRHFINYRDDKYYIPDCRGLWNNHDIRDKTSGLIELLEYCKTTNRDNQTGKTKVDLTLVIGIIMLSIPVIIMLLMQFRIII